MDLIDDFLEGYTKPQTLRAYRKSLEYFFEINKADKKTYFKDKRNYDQDFIKFIEAMEKYKPMTRKARINHVRAFLELNNVNLEKKTKKLVKLKTKNTKASTQDKVSTPQELNEILQHGTLKDRALFLFLSSSGMRIDETLHLVEDDIPSIKKHDEGKKLKFPIKVYIREEYTKTNESRITYISNETWETLLAWIKDKPRYLHQAATKSIKQKWENDPHIFPYTYPTAHRMWIRLLKQSGYDEKDLSTNRCRRHIHTLRKYFRIYVAPAAGEDVTELLLGHKDKLSNVYRDKYPEEKLGEMYLKAMSGISVFQKTSDDIRQVHEELKKKDQQMKELQGRMEKFEELLKNKDHLLTLYENQLKNGKKSA